MTKSQALNVLQEMQKMATNFLETFRDLIEQAKMFL